MITLTVDIPNDELTRAVLLDLSNVAVRVLDKIKVNIERQVRIIIKEAIENSPEYIQMLPGGSLYGLMGRPDISSILAKIKDAIAFETQVGVIRPGFKGNIYESGIEINILDSSYKNVLNIEGTSFFSEGKYAGEVEWLRWLLFEGTRKVVLGFDFKEEIKGKSLSELSRTKTGLMLKTRKEDWGLPGQYAGTEDDNWLTRATNKIINDIGEMAAQAIVMELQ